MYLTVPLHRHGRIVALWSAVWQIRQSDRGSTVEQSLRTVIEELEPEGAVKKLEVESGEQAEAESLPCTFSSSTTSTSRTGRAMITANEVQRTLKHIWSANSAKSFNKNFTANKCR